MKQAQKGLLRRLVYGLSDDNNKKTKRFLSISAKYIGLSKHTVYIIIIYNNTHHISIFISIKTASHRKDHLQTR